MLIHGSGRGQGPHWYSRWRTLCKAVEVDYFQGHGIFGQLLRSLKDSGESVEDLRIQYEALSGGGPMRQVSIEVLANRDAEIERELRRVLSPPEIKGIRVRVG